MTNPKTAPIAANEDSKPKQVSPPKWLMFGDTQFPSAEARDYIDHDFHFGSRTSQYDSSDCRELDANGVVLEFKTLRGRALYAAVVPDTIEFQCDWGTGDLHGEGYVTDWHIEWYDRRNVASRALRLGREAAGRVADDEGGTWGVAA